MTDARRAMPGVGSLLETAETKALLEANPRSVVVNAVRQAIDEARRDGSSQAITDWAERIESHIRAATTRSLRPVFNATGVVLHTNLGRAPLAQSAIDAVADVAKGFSNLEYDLATGKRGSRYVHCVDLLRELTGAEDAIVVNNCASALVLTLSALARGREVIVSRGELVEIGGSFRVPDIMQRSGATLIEVGTTNRTHLDDYRRAISSRTGAIAKIHRSNFALTGFTADVEVNALAPIASEHGIPIVHDLGSGLLIDLSDFGLSGEPTARDALDAGASVVMMSGDKLLGGPQAGIIVGKKNMIDLLRRDPFARVLRVDKMTLAALTATLELYRDRDVALKEIPALAMLTAPADAIRSRCERLSDELRKTGIESSVIESEASVGAGAFPAKPIPSFAVRLNGNANETEARLRAGDPPIIGRIFEGAFILELRSFPARDDVSLVNAIVKVLG
ncbi:MAG TPA: L-seryl-tRNA(Sec) selenium transferase [Gemmatimonadaceae bacterium]|nr:L-seryl-tRNA(Sec) selenium transferase [Gemmatimonadaceae bacterium]